MIFPSNSKLIDKHIYNSSPSDKQEVDIISLSAIEFMYGK